MSMNEQELEVFRDMSMNEQELEVFAHLLPSFSEKRQRDMPSSQEEHPGERDPKANRLPNAKATDTSGCPKHIPSKHPHVVRESAHPGHRKRT